MEIRIKVDRPRWLKVPRRRSAKLGVALLAALVVAVPAAWANHTFDDVSIFSPHHADVSTIARAGITLGCNPPANNLYCPADFVRRDQMGSFIARTLRTLTPVVRNVGGGGGTLDIDPEPVVCQTSAFTPSVAAHANIDSSVSGVPFDIPFFGELVNFTLDTVVSTDNGLSWGSTSSVFSRDGSSSSTVWANAAQVDTANLAAGTSYRFGVRVGRESGNADFADWRCQLTATMTYRDAGTSALSTSAEPTTSATPVDAEQR